MIQQSLRTKTIQIPEDGKNRDGGKTYLLTEMPAKPAELWAFRVLQGGLESDFELDAIFSGAPLAKLAELGLKFILKSLAKMPWQVADELMQQMMDRVQIVLPDGKSRSLLDGSQDIMEVSTRVLLKKEIISLQLGFFPGGGE